MDELVAAAASVNITNNSISNAVIACCEASAAAPLRAIALQRGFEKRGVGALRRGPTAIVKWSNGHFLRPFAAGTWEASLVDG